jgi:hypothetical protein
MSETGMAWRRTDLIASSLAGDPQLPVSTDEELQQNHGGGGLLGWFYFLCVWFSLPLAFWLRSSRMGLALHWEIVTGWASSGGRNRSQHLVPGSSRFQLRDNK